MPEGPGKKENIEKTQMRKTCKKTTNQGGPFLDFHGFSWSYASPRNSNFINDVAKPKTVILKTLQTGIITNKIIITSNDNEHAFHMCSSDNLKRNVCTFSFTI